MPAYDKEFQQLLDQIYAGSGEAAHQFVHRFGKSVLRAVRRRLHRKLRPHFDSDDFMQDVFGTFLCNPKRQKRFTDQEQLLRFLTKVAHNKVASKVRERMVYQRWNVNRETSIDGSAKYAVHQLTNNDPTPSQRAQNEEKWQQIGRGLTTQGRQILELLRKGHSQAEITELLGLTNTKTVYRLIERLKSQRN